MFGACNRWTLITSLGHPRRCVFGAVGYLSGESAYRSESMTGVLHYMHDMHDRGTALQQARKYSN